MVSYRRLLLACPNRAGPAIFWQHLPVHYSDGQLIARLSTSTAQPSSGPAARLDVQSRASCRLCAMKAEEAFIGHQHFKNARRFTLKVSHQLAWILYAASPLSCFVRRHPPCGVSQAFPSHLLDIPGSHSHSTVSQSPGSTPQAATPQATTPQAASPQAIAPSQAAACLTDCHPEGIHSQGATCIPCQEAIPVAPQGGGTTVSCRSKTEHPPTE